MKHTVKSVSEKLNVEKPVAQFLLKFLEDRGLCKAVGSVKLTEGKGKGYTLYEFKENYTTDLHEMLESLNQ